MNFLVKNIAIENQNLMGKDIVIENQNNKRPFKIDPLEKPEDQF